jgi:hypothetical protein
VPLQALTCINGPKVRTQSYMVEKVPVGSPITSDANSIRIMGPTSYAPYGYHVHYNSLGQAIDPLTGQTLSKAASHLLFGLPK